MKDDVTTLNVLAEKVQLEDAFAYETVEKKSYEKRNSVCYKRNSTLNFQKSVFLKPCLWIKWTHYFTTLSNWLVFNFVREQSSQ